MSDKCENKKLRKIIHTLWDLLDNIDTLDDSCRENDKAFRDATRKQQQKRWDTGITSDGYTLNIDTALEKTKCERCGKVHKPKETLCQDEVDALKIDKEPETMTFAEAIPKMIKMGAGAVFKTHYNFYDPIWNGKDFRYVANDELIDLHESTLFREGYIVPAKHEPMTAEKWAQKRGLNGRQPLCHNEWVDGIKSDWQAGYDERKRQEEE